MAPKHTIDRSTISGPTPTVQTAYNAKFQLPAIDIPQASLTEGTSIPPPKHSPPPSPPQTPLSGSSPNPLRSHPTSSHSLNQQFLSDAKSRNGHSSPPVSNYGTTARSQRGNTTSSTTRMPPPSAGSQTTAASQAPPPSSTTKRSFSAQMQVSSPPTKKRQSIRKLLSLKSLTSRSSLDVSSSQSNKQQQHPNHRSADLRRSDSPAPSTMTGFTTTTIGTDTPLRKRRSGAFWRTKRDSLFGLGSVGEDTIMSGTGEEERERYEREEQEEEERRRAEEERRRNATPPPRLPEIEMIGDGVRMGEEGGEGEGMEVDVEKEMEEEGRKRDKQEGDGKRARAKRRPSGWFGGAKMFEGII